MNKIEIINNWNIERVFIELENGNMRIPRFQRAYVWERSKIVKLLNSIYYHYPIGSFFLWDTTKAMNSFCRDIIEFNFPKEPDSNKFSFILDGQQRITSLYVALKGKILNNVDYRTICFDLDKKVFKVPHLKTEENNIPVWKIYDQSEYNNLIDGYYTTDHAELARTVRDCRDRLISYPISIIKTLNMELSEVVEIFERINQGGKRLSLFDLVHSSVWSIDFDLREKIKEFNEDKPISIFGLINPEIFTQSLALNIDDDCTNIHQLKLTNQDCKDNWEKTSAAIRLAIDFVKELGALQVAIIPYQNLLAIIQYYFFKSNEKYIKAEIRKVIVEWYWTVSFSQRYSSSTLTKMNEDAVWIRELVNGNISSRKYTIKLNVNDLVKVRMNTRSVIKNSILCLMALNTPRDFDNGGNVTLDNTNASRSNSKENHHFFPYSLYKCFGVQTDEINSVLNFAFITKRLNGQILNKKPSVYLSEYEKQNAKIVDLLDSHFINSIAFASAKADDYKGFLEARGTVLLELINKICGVNTGLSISDNYEEIEDDDDTNDIV